ncbi:MAG: glycosyltransferase family 2 protein, partial [Caulobacteraceae bacterium]
IYASYFALISLFSLLPQKRKEKYQPKYKFAAVIAARNEELVIGNLIDSLQKQRYPKELFDIIVIPNNCIDGTRQVALSKEVKLFDCKGVIKSKGDALCEFFEYILENDDIYDGFCIFDADNVVSEDFLFEMNNAMCRGVRVGQGYRDSKNPYDTIISSCYSIYYYIVNRFHNHARSVLNLSAMINGSGFMVSTDVIKKQGGWKTKSMTEDIEFTTKCVLSGEKVEWIPDAIIYDEQPLTFAQSWRQRKRWSTGLIQVLELYYTQLVKKAVTQRSTSCFDLTMFFIAPIMQILYFTSIILTIILNLCYVKYDYFPQTAIFHRLFLSLDYSYLASFIVAFAVILIERKRTLKMFKGIVTFWLFMLSWLPINILCIIRKQTEWTPIKHTRVVKINELVSEED